VSLPVGVPPSRRAVLVAGLGTAAGVVVPSVLSQAHAAEPQASPSSRHPSQPDPYRSSQPDPRSSLRSAHAFLATMADAYPDANTGVRLAQSYADELGLLSTAFVYDNALAICAHLTRGPAGRARARQLGDALLYAQAHDPGYSDGRLRQGYNVGPYTFHDGTPQPHGYVLPDGAANMGWQFGFTGTAVGDMAWPGIALLQLFSATRDARYLAGARAIGTWIVDNARSDQSLGGFTFGVDSSNAKVKASSSEHNIDAISFFTLLARASGQPKWLEQAAHARSFLMKMWNAKKGYFATGTDDGVTVNPDPVPEDVQTWAWLALRDRRYARACDWVTSSLAVTDANATAQNQQPTGVSLKGVTFSSASLTSTASYNEQAVHPQGVWLEGTAHLAAALADRNRPGDSAAAARLLGQMRSAQSLLGQGQHVGGAVLPAASGVVAASSLIDTGFGFGYFPVQHLGATAWYVMAAARANPYQHGGLNR
jgi:hypothetical protein